MEGKHVILILIALFLFAVSGLIWRAVPSEYRQAAIKQVTLNRPRVVFVLLDVSNSTHSMREQYTTGFGKILSSLKAGDRLIADRITDNPLAQSTFPINEEFTMYGIFDQRRNPIFEPMNQKELDKKKKTIKEKADKIINVPQGAPTTAILNALQLAERVFNTYKNGDKVLIIFSDMVEVSKTHNFAYAKLTQADIDNTIKQAKKVGELPNLNKVKVYAIGAGAGKENRRLKSEQWFGIQNFWLAYFAATGADLTKDRYGAALLEF